MILNDLLGLDVFDDHGERVGSVLDARFVIDGRPGQTLAEARLDGLVISPHSRHSYLGYERMDMNSPAIINALLRWMHRGTFYVRWEAVQRITEHDVHLRNGYRRFDARLSAAPGTTS
ncbi:PRC-barrel domain-containing protein [Cryobacterium tepidiphilum]|jgi:sporulation protein YlmC with PRC-barrel domain|uniref:PRC-barrel domain containing protein n=1 Tax=Cryobacterium tepidiphilum TaxID=2486026 RepID=A0A3M8L0K5_9MICO|nr:PRC-barrel domain-containing protein [Cryobacterium tepidiphilum]RNE59080.1 PRC-barrel domain containing protein [Cryobacterium tepidiphilum]